jgi:hypothetical protein
MSREKKDILFFLHDVTSTTIPTHNVYICHLLAARALADQFTSAGVTR